MRHGKNYTQVIMAESIKARLCRSSSPINIYLLAGDVKGCTMIAITSYVCTDLNALNADETADVLARAARSLYRGTRRFKAFKPRNHDGGKAYEI